MRAALRAGLHVAALWALAVAQPLFDLLGGNAEFFAVRDATWRDVVTFGVGIVVLPPVAIVLVVRAAGLVHRRLAEVLHLVAIGGLLALLALQATVRNADLGSAVLFPVAALVGVAGVFAYAKLPPARTFLTVLSPAPLLFLGLFLFVSPASELVLADDPEPRAVEIAAKTPVVLVVFDELSAISLLDEQGRIDAGRYPSFAALASDSTWFRNAATVNAWTTNAVPAILTGVYPMPGRLPVFAEHPDNLFTLLGGGYRLHVFESMTRLCPPPLCPDSGPSYPSRMESLFSDTGLVYLHLALPRDVRQRLPSVTGTWGAFLESSHERTRRRVTVYRDFVSTLPAGGAPTLAFAHVMLPHIPWEFLPSGRRYDGEDLPGFETKHWGSNRFLVEQGYQRYLLQLGFADRLLGELLRRLRAVGLYDRALVVVSADHGVSFHPDGRRRAFTEANLADVALVPLLVKEPGQEKRRIADDPVQTVDILPTIAAAAGVEVPWRLDGRSLLGSSRRDRFVLVGDNETFTAEPSSLEERRAASLRRQVALFGSGLYRIGPNPELLGRRVEQLVVVPAEEASAQLDQAGELRSVDLAAEEIPARLTGSVAAGGAPGRSLAVAVGGRIAAVARSYAFGGEERYSVLIPESALRQGANRVELFWVRPGPVLVRLFTLR